MEKYELVAEIIKEAHRLQNTWNNKPETPEVVEHLLWLYHYSKHYLDLEKVDYEK